MPVLGNLFGTVRRICLAMGVEDTAALRGMGKLLAALREPEAPKGLRDLWERLPELKGLASKVFDMVPKELSSGPCQEVGVGGQGRRPRAPAGADLLARGRRAAHHLGAHGDARAAQGAPEPRHLPPAGDRAEPRDHALARASRRRARFPRPQHRASGPAVSGRRRAGRRSGDHPRRGHAGARYAGRVPVRGPAARRAHRAGEVPRQRPAGAGLRRDRAGRRDPSGGRRAGRPARRSHRLLQRSREIPGADGGAHDDAPRPRSITAPTPASRPTSRPCWASRSTKCSCP